MIKVIGHRGARGLAPENTLAAIKAGLAAGVDGIEIDVRLTADKRFVLSHDPTLERLWGVNKKVSELTLHQARSVTKGHDGPIVTLEEALEAVGKTPLIIECKSGGWAKELSKLLANHPKRSQCTVIAFNHPELFTFSQYCPGLPTLSLTRDNPFDALNDARIYGFDGIDVHYWAMNPLLYWLTKRHKLSMTVYTLNLPWIANILRIFYPQISITTDVPQKFQFLRPKELRVRPNSRLRYNKS